jgi:hypothetical protein
MKRLHISSLIVIGAVATLFASVAPAAPVDEAPSAPSKEFACSKDKSCPMQKWMKANMGAALASEDFAALSTALGVVMEKAPKGYPKWVSIAKKGKDAADAKNLVGVKGACDECHKTEKYKDKYKDEMRDQPWP